MNATVSERTAARARIAPFAVPDEADFLAVDLLAPRRYPRGQGIPRVVLDRGRRHAAGAADSPVINRNTAMPRQVQIIGQHQERLVPEQLFVAILRPGPVNDQHRQDRPALLGQR